MRRWVRRARFAFLAAAIPGRSKALYQLIARPASVDATAFGGLFDARTLDRLKSSSLISTGSVQVPLRLAEILYLNGRIEEAFEWVRRTPGLEPQLMDGWFSLYTGDIARAMTIFAAAAETQSAKSEALANLALCHYLEGDLDKAMDSLSIAAAFDPRTTFPMLLFSRIVRHREDIRRYLSEKARLARLGQSASNAAAFVRACGRAGAVMEGEDAARAAVADINRARTAPGPKKHFYSRGAGELILKHVVDVAQNADIRLFPMGGTLLGLIRDGELIPFDKDLDFGCFVEEASFRDLWEVFLSSAYFVPMGAVEDRLIKLRHLSGATVDIFVNFREGDGRWHGGSFVCWRDRAFELKRADVRGRQFFIPDDPETYLENHYGPSWGRRDPHFDVFWEAPNAYAPNKERRYLSTIARGLQLLAAGSTDMMEIRLERAKKANVEDVVAAYEYISRARLPAE